MSRRSLFALVPVACLLAGLGHVVAGSDSSEAVTESVQSDSTRAAKVRYVVFHSPGPAWAKGVDFREQPGVMEHVTHYRKLHEAGKLALGGPFLLKDAGGMMIPAAGVGFDEISEFAAADPAIQSGLLLFEVRPWYVAMDSGDGTRRSR